MARHSRRAGSARGESAKRDVLVAFGPRARCPCHLGKIDRILTCIEPHRAYNNANSLWAGRWLLALEPFGVIQGLPSGEVSVDRRGSVRDTAVSLIGVEWVPHAGRAFGFEWKR